MVLLGCGGDKGNDKSTESQMTTEKDSNEKSQQNIETTEIHYLKPTLESRFCKPSGPDDLLSNTFISSVPIFLDPLIIPELCDVHITTCPD